MLFLKGGGITSSCGYLGCVINDKGDPKREVNKRLGECYSSWKALDMFLEACETLLSSS